MPVNLDEKFISYALNLAKKHLGITAPNPVVACIIVVDGEIIASAITARNGRPHAEKIAIDLVQNKEVLTDATLYVTLEPCCHIGISLPCVDEIIKYKIKKVVIATKDDDLRVDGKGIVALRDAGIDVICGIMENQAREINKGFFKARNFGLPYVTIKIAASLDGKIATKNFDSKWITNEKSRRFGHYLRANSDAILVGATTVKKDNPSLDCRIAGLEEFSPRKIIISNDFDFDFSAKIFEDEVVILTNKTPSKTPPPQIKVILCKEKNNLVDLHDALKKLCDLGINSILVEGGSAVITGFLQEKLVDELVLIRSNKIIGNDGIAAIGGLNVASLNEAIANFNRVEIKEFNQDIVEIYKRQSR